jgi:hypothetical protein
MGSSDVPRLVSDWTGPDLLFRAPPSAQADYSLGFWSHIEDRQDSECRPRLNHMPD